MRRQADAARSTRLRFRLGLDTIGLRRFELRVLRASQRVFDISIDDIKFWESCGFNHLAWLPPTVDVSEDQGLTPPEKFDVVFLGNLNTPNNVESVRWLVEDVVPKVRLKIPNLSVCIAGSRPSAEVSELCRTQSNVRLVANPPSAWAVYRSARLLVNPARSGSGMQIKTAEMLHVPVPLVCTSVGAQGLPEDVKASMNIADTAETFARAIAESLKNPEFDPEIREAATRIFSAEKTLQVVREIDVRWRALKE